MLRVDVETKDRVERAARLNHETLTAFLVRAGLKEAHRVERRGPLASASPSRGVPSFFRACCRTAAYGGGATYEEPGYQLAIHTAELCGLRDDVREVGRKLRELRAAVSRDHEDVIDGWYRREFPRCMELVSRKRRDQFVKGVRRAYEEKRL